MATTQTKTKTEVRTKTRVRVLQEAAEHFMQETEEAGARWAHILRESEVICAMKLVDWFEVILHTKDEPVAGVRMSFDWQTHEVMLESAGEDYDDALLDGYDRPGSVTEAVSALREYIDATKAECEVTVVQAWYQVRQARVDELGIERVNQLLGRSDITPEQRKLWGEQYTLVEEARAKKGTSTELAASDLPETNHSAW
jgi:hypothetical protein